jgi:aryl-alcohol dehydrogenase-like predicted oxidoreductase
MIARQVGKSGLTVSALGLGCMGMSQSYGPGDDEESTRTIHRALDLGVTLLDTADAYGRGANETLVGRAILGRRHTVVLSTKCGLIPGPGGSIGVNGRPEYIRAACDASLRRLQTDVIDLYYLHRVDPETPIDDSVGAMADLVKQGKVRFLGLSEAAPGTIRRACAVHPIAAVQSEYSLWFREPEPAVLPTCRELGLGFVAFSPLGRGFLTGSVTDVDALSADDMRRTIPRFQGENLQRNIALVDRLQGIAARMGATPSQLAIAWLLAKGRDIIPIPGTKRRRYLDENVAAAGIELGAGDVSGLDAAFLPDAVSGDRYSREMARLLDT